MGEKSFRIERTEYEALDPGQYVVKVADLELTEGQYGKQIQWSLRVKDSDATLKAWTSAKMSSGSKLGKWVVALTGSLPEAFEPLDFLGMECLATVATEMRADGSEYNKVTALRAPRRKVKPVVEADMEELWPEEQAKGEGDGPEPF